MTIRSAFNISQVQIDLLAEIVELTDAGFKYVTSINRKRNCTLKALEKRYLIRLDQGTSFSEAHVTSYGRDMLNYLK
jgi:hypothetical protein